MIQLSMPTAVFLIVSFLGLVFGFGAILMRQFERRMGERFTAQAELRQEEKENSQARMTELEHDMSKLITRVERQSINLPLQYVRREDWIRFSTTIDTKLDRLAELYFQSPPGATRAGQKPGEKT